MNSTVKLFTFAFLISAVVALCTSNLPILRFLGGLLSENSSINAVIIFLLENVVPFLLFYLAGRSINFYSKLKSIGLALLIADFFGFFVCLIGLKALSAYPNNFSFLMSNPLWNLIVPTLLGSLLSLYLFFVEFFALAVGSRKRTSIPMTAKN